ncbi:hypothetical protein LCGC14_1568000, partial [marine sediment metagenome]
LAIAHTITTTNFSVRQERAENAAIANGFHSYSWIAIGK